ALPVGPFKRRVVLQPVREPIIESLLGSFAPEGSMLSAGQHPIKAGEFPDSLDIPNGGIKIGNLPPVSLMAIHRATAQAACHPPGRRLIDGMKCLTKRFRMFKPSGARHCPAVCLAPCRQVERSTWNTCL